MIKKRAFAVLSFSLLTVTWCCAQSRHLYTSRGGEPEVKMMEVVGPTNVNLGSILHGVITNVPFRIRNVGGQKLDITRLVPTCPCIKGNLDLTNSIAPGRERVVTMQLDSKTLHGAFERGMWVCANDMSTPYLQLRFFGTVKPVFTGLPERPVGFTFRELNQPVTNLFELTAAEAGWSLGEPSVKSDSAGLTALTTLKSVAGSEGAYLLQVVSTPKQPGKHRAVIEVPVTGSFQAMPLKVTLVGNINSPLTTTPQQINLALGVGKKQVFRFILRGPNKAKLDTGKVKWGPLPEGVAAEALAGRQDNELLIRIAVADSAIDALYSNKDAAVQISYEGIGEIVVPFKMTTDDESSASSRVNRSQKRLNRGGGGGLRNLRF